MGKNDSSEIFSLDYDNLTCSVAYDLCEAKNSGFLDGVHSNFDVVLVPQQHHLYSGRLKSAGYNFLNGNNSFVFVIFFTNNSNGISLFSEDISFMGKKWSFYDPFDKTFFSNFKINYSIDFFDKIQNELPYLRIISNFDKVFFLNIGTKISKKKLEIFFQNLSGFGNIVFVSDLHSGLSLKECENFDEKSINGNTDLLVFELFFSLSKMLNKKIVFVGYGNTADLNGNKENCTGFCTLGF